MANLVLCNLNFAPLISARLEYGNKQINVMEPVSLLIHQRTQQIIQNSLYGNSACLHELFLTWWMTPNWIFFFSHCLNVMKHINKEMLCVGFFFQLV